jgi:hypothetical protein
MSCHRFSLRDPGALVCASSSTIEHRAAVFDDSPGHDLEVANLGNRVGPIVRLEEADHDVGAPLLAPPAFVKHGVCLPDTRCRAEVDP